MKNFQSNQYIKNSGSKDKFKQGKNMVIEKEVSQQRKDRYKSWNTFFRNNPSYFITLYMQVRLYPYQRYWINLMAKSTNFIAVASRASAKSFLIAVYSISKCILYPGTIVSLNSSTKSQAGLIISQHCQSLYNEHPNIQRETLNIVTNQNVWAHSFRNGSKIEVVISGEAGRGHRSNVSVLEERRLIPTEIIDSIIRPFLVSRTPPYVKKSEYLNVPREESQEIIITSSYYKAFDWYSELKKLFKMILDGDKDVKAVLLDYLIVIKHHIKTKKQLDKEKEKMGTVAFDIEYGNIPYGSSENSFFKMKFFDRSIKTAWRPSRDEFSVFNKKGNSYDIDRKPGEIRIVAVDIAMKKGKANDNTAITCGRLFPTKKGWITEIPYMETMNGKNALIQALRIKQIYNEFTGFHDKDILVMDIAGAGITVYDALTSLTKDDSRGVEYNAMKVMNHPTIDQKVYEELIERCISNDAKPCIYPISATQQLNSQIAVAFRDRLKRKMLRFLVDENEEEEFLIKNGNRDILDQKDIGARAYLLSPNIQTTLLINESISLEMSVINAETLKLQEPGNSRKDRYSSCSYLNWYVDYMDKELLKENPKDDWESIRDVTFII